MVWCALTTVDRCGRPRSRILHPIWQSRDNHLTGWITTRQSPLKTAHLALNPYVSCTYLAQNHDVAIADCQASWEEYPAERERVWNLFRQTPPPLGYDPFTIWPEGPIAPTFSVLRLTRWRLQVTLVDRMTSGEPPLVWRPATL